MQGKSTTGHPTLPAHSGLDSFDKAVRDLRNMDAVDGEIVRIIRAGDQFGVPMAVAEISSILTERGHLETYSQVADRVDALVRIGRLDRHEDGVCLGQGPVVLGEIS